MNYSMQERLVSMKHSYAISGYFAMIYNVQIADWIIVWIYDNAKAIADKFDLDYQSAKCRLIMNITRELCYDWKVNNENI